MQTVVFDHPCLILEASELVYAVVNRIPAARLTEEAPFCIPPKEVQRIMQEVCYDLDPEDAELRFYFGGVALEENEGSGSRLACVANCMIGSVEPICHDDVRQAQEMMHHAWFAKGHDIQVLGVNADGIAVRDASQYTTLGQEFGKLPIPASYQVKLVEVFSAFHRHVDRLCDILSPIAQRLKPLLEPWVQQAAPRAEQWREGLRTESGQQALLKRCKVVPEEVDQLQIALRYFTPFHGHGDYDVENRMIRLHVGIALPPSQAHVPEDDHLSAKEHTVLRLLSNPDRLAMLRAMNKTAKSTQELSKELGLNPGSVFRDLNNLYNAGILHLEVISGRDYYTADLHQIEEITTHLVRYLKQDIE